MSESPYVFPIPRHWNWTKVGRIASVIRGASPRPKGDPRYFGGSIPWIMISDINREKGKYLSATKEGVTPEGAKRSRLLKPGSLILSNSGSVCIPKILRVEGCIHDGFVTFPNLPDHISPEYLYYWFEFIRPQVIRANRQGITQVNLNTGIVRELDVPLPPHQEQHRIVAKIEELSSDLDAGVAALKRAKANLKRYRAAVLKAAVEGKLTQEWRADHPDVEPASKLLDRILAERRQKWEADQLSKFAAAGKQPPKNWRAKYVEPAHESGSFALPPSWTWCSTLEACDRVENGNTPPAAEMQQGYGEVPFIKVYNLTKSGRLDFSVNPTFISRSTHERRLARSRIFPGDVLMNIVGPPLGKVSVVPDDFPEWNTNQAVVLFRASPSILPQYLATCLLTDGVLGWILKTARATAGQFNVSVGNSRLLPVPLPPLEEQKAIINLLDEKLSGIESAESTIDKGLPLAGHLRQSILQTAFKGMLLRTDPNAPGPEVDVNSSQHHESAMT